MIFDKIEAMIGSQGASTVAIMLFFIHPQAFAGDPDVRSPGTKAPSVRSLLKSDVYDSVVAQRDVKVYAKLEGERYSFYAVALVNVGVALANRFIKDYKIFDEIVPFVDRADFNTKTEQLLLEGGIFDYRLRSYLRFAEHDPGWIEFKVVGGHFLGLEGEIYLEDLSGKTLVYLGGRHQSKLWPPSLVMERGAEIALSVSTSRLRTYIEDHRLDYGNPVNHNVPQPRRRL